MGELSDRRSQTAKRLNEFRAGLKQTESLASGRACVYATGSFGRCEASSHSDLDVFILGKSKAFGGGGVQKVSALSNLDEILIKAELIQLTRNLGIQEFSNDGRYVVHYAVHQLTEMLGKPEDDASNTFTARLLLLLESQPLVGAEVYKEIIGEVIAEYWRDYPDHQDQFIPAYLANDILRLWRTFCVNYEAGTEREPDDKKAKGKLKNYKLKHSRLLTCYSAVVYLLAIYRLKNTVTPQDALAMSQLTPTERLEWLKEQPALATSAPLVDNLLHQYETFLAATNAPEIELVNEFRDSKKSKDRMKNAYTFGDSMFTALMSVAGSDQRFLRVLLV